MRGEFTDIMHSISDVATQSLFHPPISIARQLEEVLGKAMTRAVDSADIYLQGARGESWSLEDGIVKTGRF